MRRTILVGLLCGMVAACSGGVGLAGDGGPDGIGDTASDATDDAVPDGGEEGGADVADGALDETGGDTTDGGADCAPMDAHAEGACEMILPGVVWDGAHCVPLGSGCSCAGADCAAVYDTVAECVAARQACYGDVCAAQDAAGRVCDGGGCAIVFGPFWDGRACFTTAGCECAGADCGAGFASAEECDAVHAGCDAAMCLATGGQWFPATAGFCGFACGLPVPEDCLVPVDACSCGPGRTFLPGSGCATEIAACDSWFLCLASGGAWHPASDGFCPFQCGVPLPECYAITDTCDCGAHRNFDATAGCLPAPSCADTDRAAICASTGGTWHDCAAGDPGCSCGDYHCGMPNLLDPCVMPGCDCGWRRNFDADRGCVDDASCFDRAPGEDCRGGAADSTCRSGLVCCADSGITDHSACRAPCCPDDPSCTADGCPLPPP